MDKNCRQLYSFEDYQLLRYNHRIFNEDNSISHYDLHQYSYGYSNHVIINNQVPVCCGNYYDEIDWEKMITNHKELVNTAKSLYVYPQCKIPRKHVAEKYKKVLNPWLADAVVVPDNIVRNEVYTGRFFINEDAKKIFLFYDDYGTKFPAFEQGTKMYSILSNKHINELKVIAANYPNLYADEMLNAEFLGVYNYTVLGANENFKIDILNGTVPLDKTIKEQNIMESLGNEENDITFEALDSIWDMLNSTDNDTVAAGIKALSSMDYIHYPLSIKFVLNHASNWVYNKATDTTAAKYMFNKILGGTARAYVRLNENRDIEEKDWEILHQLVEKYFEYKEERVNNYLRNLNCTYEDANYNVFPRLKKTTA